MSWSPPERCRMAGCWNLTRQHFCEDHLKHSVAQQLRKERRGPEASAAARGYDASWERLRRLALQRDRFLCQRCMRQGVETMLTYGSPVDHVIPIRERPDLRLVMSNLQSLCVACHNRKSREDARRRAAGGGLPQSLALSPPGRPGPRACGPASFDPGGYFDGN